MGSENLLTTEVAELVRTSPETVRYWRHVGKGPRSYKVGRRVLYRRDDVMEWLDRQYSAGGKDVDSRPIPAAGGVR